MRLPIKTLAAAALIAAAVPLYGGAAAAAPLSQSLALNSADVGTVEQVQYRHWNRGRWIGPAAAGLAAGAIIGGAIASSQYNDGYYAYGAAPADGYYAYGAAPGYAARGYYAAPGYAYGADSRVRSSPQYGSCTGDRDGDSAFPSWACR